MKPLVRLIVEPLITTLACLAAGPAAARDEVQLSPTIAKAAADLAQAVATACARAPLMDELRLAFADGGAGLPLIALVYTRAPFAAAQAIDMAGPGFTLDEAWRSVEAHSHARAAFDAWRDGDHDLALAAAAGRLCVPAGGKR